VKAKGRGKPGAKRESEGIQRNTGAFPRTDAAPVGGRPVGGGAGGSAAAAARRVLVRRTGAAATGSTSGEAATGALRRREPASGMAREAGRQVARAREPGLGFRALYDQQKNG